MAILGGVRHPHVHGVKAGLNGHLRYTHEAKKNDTEKVWDVPTCMESHLTSIVEDSECWEVAEMRLHDGTSGPVYCTDQL